MPREGVGVALGAQVRHVVTYSDPPEGTLRYTVFTKKCQKRSKKGVPPVFDRFCTTYLGGVHARRLEKVEFFLHPAMFNGEIIDL